MDAIFELIIHLIIELLGTFLAYFVDYTNKKIESNRKVRLTIKYIVSFTLYFIVLLILIFSIYKNKDNLLILLSVIMMLVIVLNHLFSYINKNFLKKKFISIFLFVIKEIIFYSYFLTLIILYVNIDKYDNKYLIVSGIIGIIILLLADGYRYRRKERRKNENANLQ